MQKYPEKKGYSKECTPVLTCLSTYTRIGCYIALIFFILPQAENQEMFVIFSILWTFYFNVHFDHRKLSLGKISQDKFLCIPLVVNDFI